MESTNLGTFVTEIKLLNLGFVLGMETFTKMPAWSFQVDLFLEPAQSMHNLVKLKTMPFAKPEKQKSVNKLKMKFNKN